MRKIKKNETTKNLTDGLMEGAIGGLSGLSQDGRYIVKGVRTGEFIVVGVDDGRYIVK
jgi:hypothetical protein